VFVKYVWASSALLLATGLFAAAQSVSDPAAVAETRNGYLLLTIERVAHQDSVDANSQGPNGIKPIKQTQKFKILLDSDFFSEFQNN
jgi:hypothetical protein